VLGRRPAALVRGALEEAGGVGAEQARRRAVGGDADEVLAGDEDRVVGEDGGDGAVVVDGVQLPGGTGPLDGCAVEGDELGAAVGFVADDGDRVLAGGRGADGATAGVDGEALRGAEADAARVGGAEAGEGRGGDVPERELAGGAAGMKAEERGVAFGVGGGGGPVPAVAGGGRVDDGEGLVVAEVDVEGDGAGGVAADGGREDRADAFVVDGLGAEGAVICMSSSTVKGRAPATTSRSITQSARGGMGGRPGPPSTPGGTEPSGSAASVRGPASPGVVPSSSPPKGRHPKSERESPQVRTRTREDYITPHDLA